MTNINDYKIKRELFYNGQWQKPLSSKSFDVTNPATGESLGQVAAANKDDLDAAVQSAHDAFKTWKQTPPLERADYLKRAAKALLDHKKEIAMIDAIDGGNPATFMEKDIDYMAVMLEYFAGLVTELKGETIPVGPNNFDYTLREPLGVVAGIVAFNHPALFVSWSMAAPIAAGNTFILKPAEQTPLSALYIAELFQDIFPAGVFNVITGDRDLGPHIPAHPLIRKVMFIGSIPTGKAILKSSAETLKQVTLEMGGKNALIIYPDYDPKKAASVAIAGMNFAWCGQSCGSTSRVMIHESIYDEVLNEILEQIKTVKPGIPTEPETIMGCLASREHFEKVMSYVQVGKDDGAKLVYGGEIPTDPELKNGTFLLPTIFADVTQEMRIANEEIFGPIMSVMKWSDEDKMLDEVNCVQYGLTGAMCTNDLNTAHKTASKIESGYIWVNQAGPHVIGAPFGGQKQSGMGRLSCLQTLLDCTQLKNVNIAF